MNNRPPPAFVGSPPSPRSPSLCFPSPKQHKSTEKPGLCGRSSKRRSPVLAAIGALILVLAYTTFGSVLFVTLETYDSGKSEETAVAASKPYPRTDLINSEIRSRTVDRLWSITEDLNILYKENWTRLAAQEVQHFQDTLLRAVQSSKLQQPGLQPVIKAYRWDYASGFLYSLALITTVESFISMSRGICTVKHFALKLEGDQTLDSHSGALLCHFNAMTPLKVFLQQNMVAVKF
ncbi:hypothetical protein DMENIID0001_164930 [Sergentomyia squamirostris]